MRVVCALVLGSVAATGCVSNDILARVTSSAGGAGGDVGAGGASMLADSDAGAGTGAGGAAAASGGCSGLRCQLSSCRGTGCLAPSCAGGAHTTVSGTVYDPAGKVPLYGVSVYVPNAPLPPVAEGVSCGRCDQASAGDPIVKATTDAAGHFTLVDVPVGAGVPLVIETGKWRRQSAIPNVAACADTVLTDPEVTRLPRNQGEGHLPRIALTTGRADALECLLRKIGIDDAEFTPESGTGRINLFGGGMDSPQGDYYGTNSYMPRMNDGAAFTPAPAWWEDDTNLMKYDMILHSCEGIENSTNKSTAAREALQYYANSGGRVFASHWHNYWFEHGPTPFPSVATFRHDVDPVGPGQPFTATIDTSFAKGAAMADWLVNVGASQAPGQLEILGAKHTVDAVNPDVSQRWIYSTDPLSVQYLSFATPIGAPGGLVCGKVVFSDLHVSSGSMGPGTDISDPSLPFPSGCVTTDLSPQEKALEFMLFELSSCVEPPVQ
jgi:hypothetical protein